MEDIMRIVEMAKQADEKVGHGISQACKGTGEVSGSKARRGD